VVGLLVGSHWFLDLVVHRPDLPLLGDGGLKVGFGLWDSVAGTLVVELGMLAGGLATGDPGWRTRTSTTWRPGCAGGSAATGRPIGAKPNGNRLVDQAPGRRFANASRRRLSHLEEGRSCFRRTSHASRFSATGGLA
jgi:hypothetical protein